MIEVPEKVISKIVVKRDGKKVVFDGTKIALAIKKGFDSVVKEENVSSYSEIDINKVYLKVLNRIEKIPNDRIKIEEIQDLIEIELKNNGYEEVYKSFSEYREKRAQSRKLFFDEKKQHKFLKALEKLGLKTVQQEEIKQSSNNTAIGTMLQYGGTISKEFAKSYLMKKKFAEAHENGDIYIHNLDFFPVGTTACCQIDLHKLYEDGFAAGEGFIRKPNNINSYAVLTAIAIQANQNDQHGIQSIPAFDFYMASGVLKTFKKQFKEIVFDYLELTDFDKFIATNGITREIERINSVVFDVAIFYKYCRESEELKRLFQISYTKALEKTKRSTYQAMEAFVHNLNNVHSKTRKGAVATVNFGTDTSPEGRIAIKSLISVIQAGIGNNQNPTSPICIFKVKEGINYLPDDKNYDLFEKACELASSKKIVHFSFIDAPFNLKYYKEGKCETEVAYLGENTRIIENDIDENKQISAGRGVISTTTINLPRIGIKCAKFPNEKDRIKKFYIELEEKMDLVKDQLLERFEVQCEKRAGNFPFLFGQNVWVDSEKLKPTDSLKKVLKQGSIGIGFVGLAECLKALIGKNHGESEEAQKLGIEIVKFMREKCDEYTKKYNLNFELTAEPTKAVASIFCELDQAIYGKLKGINTKESYTSSFQIPQNAKISIQDRIEKEAVYHKLTNGGHVTVIEENSIQPKQVMKIVQKMKNAGIGHGIIRNNSI